MLFEKVEKRRIITFHFETRTVDVGECIQSQQHWSKQHSKVVTPVADTLWSVHVLYEILYLLRINNAK